MIKFTKVIDDFEERLAWVLKWSLALLTLLVCYEVFMRYVLKQPTIWGLDIRTQLYAVSTMIGLPYTLMVHGHVVVDTFTINLSFKTQKWLEIINYILWYFPTMTVLTYTMYSLTALSFRLLEGSGSPWNPPVYPLKAILLACYFLCLVRGVVEIMKDWISIQKGSDDWIKER